MNSPQGDMESPQRDVNSHGDDENSRRGELDELLCELADSAPGHFRTHVTVATDITAPADSRRHPHDRLTPVGNIDPAHDRESLVLSPLNRR